MTLNIALVYGTIHKSDEMYLMYLSTILYYHRTYHYTMFKNVKGICSYNWFYFEMEKQKYYGK